LGDKLGPEAINKILKKLELASGSEEARLSGHSFRVGRTADFIASGASVGQIALMGGWTAEAMVLRYAKSWQQLQFAQPNT